MKLANKLLCNWQQIAFYMIHIQQNNLVIIVNNLSVIIDYSEDLESINEVLSIYVATEEELEEHKTRIRKTYKED